MKRTLLVAVMALMLTPAVFAQVYKLDEKKLLQKIQESDEAIANEKRAARGQTWLDRGDALFNAGSAASEKLFAGMALPILTSQLGKETAKSTKQMNGETYIVLSFPWVDVYLLNDIVQFWEEKVVVYDNALEKSYEAYKKAVEIDPKLRTKAADGIQRIANFEKQRAYNNYLLNQLIKAAEGFRKAYDLQIDPMVNVIDTAAVFNAGYFYAMQEDFVNAIDNLSIARELGYWSEGSLGYYLMFSYVRTDQDEKAKEVITEAAKLFPGNNTVIEGLINYYSVSGDDMNEIKDIIVAALEKDPENLVLLDGMGRIYYSEQNMDKVVEIYSRFLKIEPDNFAANFFMAEAWIQKANQQIVELGQTSKGMSEAAEKEAVAAINDLFRKSLLHLEKAYEANPSQKAIVQRLVQIYYQLGSDDPQMEAKYEKFKKIQDAM